MEAHLLTSSQPILLRGTNRSCRQVGSPKILLRGTYTTNKCAIKYKVHPIGSSQIDNGNSALHLPLGNSYGINIHGMQVMWIGKPGKG